MQMVGFLIPLLDDKFPLIRSISCWTISRFSKYVVQVLSIFVKSTFFFFENKCVCFLPFTKFNCLTYCYKDKSFIGAALPSVFSFWFWIIHLKILLLSIQESGHQIGYEQFDKVLMGLLRRILDTNKRVQEAACSALATLEEVLPAVSF